MRTESGPAPATRTASRVGAALLAACLALAGALAGAIGGAQPAAAAVVPADAVPPLSVTYAVRFCPTYGDIMANKARNNIMESLRDLGPDSSYRPDGIVDPTSEASGSPACQPLTGWTLSTGRGLQSKTEASHFLSTVTGPYAGGTATTQSSTDLLGSDGRPTGGSILGAVTVPLTDEQAADVRAGLLVVAQSGVGNETLNGLQTTYGFGALRCAQDALNGDNVDYISFPNGARHVFCFLYLVTPPPDPGSITIVKQLAPGTIGPGDRFTYEGSLSYDHVGGNEGRFTLAADPGANGSQTFIRGSVGPDDPPWTVEELPPPGWVFDSVVCEAEGESTWAIDGAEVAIALAPDDDVTCTYTNSRAPTGPATLNKQTLGGVGTFPFTVVAPGSTVDATVTTTQPGVPELVTSTLGTQPGVFTATETVPTMAAGVWSLAAAECNGLAATPVNVAPGVWQASRTFAPGESVDCLFTNVFTPTASISIEKITEGATGTFEYEVFPVDDSDVPVPVGEIFTTSATTTATDTATPAEEAYEGINVFEHTLYGIQERLPAVSDEGVWRMVSAECQGAETSVDTVSAYVTVEVSEANPNPVCTFTNEFVPVGRVTIVKHTSDDLQQRPDDVVLRLDCGVGIVDVLIEPGLGTESVTPYLVYGDDHCDLEELATGAAPGWTVTVDATITVDDDPPLPFDELGGFDVGAGLDVVVEVTNVYAAAPTPPPTGPPAPPSGPSGGLAESGFDAPAPVVAALAALLAGALLTGAARLRAGVGLRARVGPSTWVGLSAALRRARSTHARWPRRSRGSRRGR